MLCIAALDLNEDELRRLLLELRSKTWSEIIEEVSALRQYAMNFQIDTIDKIDKGKKRTSTKRSSSNSYDVSVGERVERLLKVEAGLTTSQAANELSLLLDNQGLIKLEDIPPVYRKPLSKWVDKLAESVPEKDILRFATIIRNEYVHRPITDWTLKGLFKK
jgi:hypothetical protein